MYTKSIKFLLPLFLLTISLNAQKQELGKVTIEELKEVKHPKDSTAAAAFLFNKCKTYFEYSQSDGFMVKTDVFVKLKIYKKEGYEWANNQVKIYIGGTKKERVDFEKAVTYNLVNGAIEKTKLKGEGEFTEHINKYWDVKKITMPNVKEGSIIEYSYTISSPYISNLQAWDFQKSIPVNYSEYKTYVPEYFIYSAYSKGSLMPKITVAKPQKSIVFNQMTKAAGVVAKTNFEQRTIDYVESQTTYILSDVPALKEEAFVNNIDNYTASISNELVSIQYPDSAFENYATNWEDITKRIYESEDFGNQLNKNNYYEDDVKALIQGLTTVDEKVETIFNYVKSRMNWNKFNGIYCDNGVKKAYQDKTGNSADINLMLVSMLRFAGLESNPVLISTRSNGIAIFPTRTAFNTVIAGVQNGQNLILLDATNKFSCVNILPTEDLNWLGRIIKKDGTSEFVELTPKDLSIDSRNMIFTLDEKGELSGKVRNQFSNYFAFRYRNSKLSAESYIEKLEKEENIEVSEYELTNDDNFNEPIVEKFTVKSANSVDIIGNKMYISPLLYLATKENPFKQETREYPVDFSFPLRNKYLINITIPDGYAVENLPKPMAIAMDQNFGTYKFSITNTSPNLIQVSATLDINSPIIPSEDYNTLKEFFKMMIEKENEKIVLIKK